MSVRAKKLVVGALVWGVFLASMLVVLPTWTPRRVDDGHGVGISAASAQSVDADVVDIDIGALPSVPDTGAPSPPAPVSTSAERSDVAALGHDALQAARDAARAPTVMKIAAAITAALWVLIAVLRRHGHVLLDGQKVRRLVLLVGGAAAFSGAVADGLPWWQVAMLGGSGPGAVLVEELLSKPVRRWLATRKPGRAVTGGGS